MIDSATNLKYDDTSHAQILGAPSIATLGVLMKMIAKAIKETTSIRNYPTILSHTATRFVSDQDAKSMAHRFFQILERSIIHSKEILFVFH